MENINQELSGLIYGYIRGTLSASERQKLELWLQEPANRSLFDKISNKEYILQKSLLYDKYEVEKNWQAINGRIIPGRVKRNWLFYAAAVIIPVLLVGSGFFIFHTVSRTTEKSLVTEIFPGESGATLYLANGRVVDLNVVQSGVVASDQQVKMTNATGELICEAKASEQTEHISYNTIKTPKGGEYRIVLPDGSVVWLNAGSTLKFPNVFAGGVRRVYAEGELYFKVNRNEKMPFIVTTKGMDVEVLGTEFNIRAYADEQQIAATLISGSVKVMATDENLTLHPGQQACFDQVSRQMNVADVAVESFIAWKNGYFLFENKRLEDILNELGRWYDMDLFFVNSAVRDERFSVEVKRHENFREVIRLIEGTGTVKLEVKGKTVFVK